MSNYLKHFEHHSDYTSIEATLETPYVCSCEDDDNIHYKRRDWRKEYLTFEALETGTFKLTIGSAVTTSVLQSISYSLDSGETWTTTDNVTGQKVEITTPSVNAGDKVMWKGKGTGISTVVASASADRPTTSSIFSSTGNFNAMGNILSLLYEDDFAEEDSVTGTYNFALMFYANGMAEYAKLVSCENMVLPTGNISECCFFRAFQSSPLVTPMRSIETENISASGCCFMFYKCLSLKSAPKIKASTIGQYGLNYLCYGCTNLISSPSLIASSIGSYSCYGMFVGCSGLTMVGSIGESSTTLGTMACSYMFQDCINLAMAPELPSVNLGVGCYRSMFSRCSGIVVGPQILPATSIPTSAYCYMFESCTNLVTAPTIKANTIGASGCSCMFYNNTNLTNAPKLSATTLGDACYYAMFYNCKSLASAPSLPATTLAEECYYAMFYLCENLVTAPELSATTLETRCYHSMFAGCKSLVVAPELPATTLAFGCYNLMFSECSSLKHAPELPAQTLTDECYDFMFTGCTSLITPPELPSTGTTSRCYCAMFQGCVNLEYAPVLPALTVGYKSYDRMFNGCSKINYIECLATDISADDATANWLAGTAAEGTFVKNPEMEDWTTGVNGIPEGWTVENAS